MYRVAGTSCVAYVMGCTKNKGRHIKCRHQSLCIYNVGLHGGRLQVARNVLHM